MADDNLKIWNALSKTDPAHTKKFTRAGGFKGTSIKPIYMIRMMTEQFGPAGKGWGMDEPSFQVVPAGDCIMVYCTVALWWSDTTQKVYGVGGDIVMGKNRNGAFTDDEAFKKSYTDALSNAMKQIGVGADVHMGQHDDDKYVSELNKELHQEAEKNPPGITAFRNESRAFYKELYACTDYDQYIAFIGTPNVKAFIKKAQNEFPKDWNGDGEDIKGIKEDMRIFCERLKATEQAA